MQNEIEVALEFKQKALSKLCGGRIPQSLNLNSHATMHTALTLASQEIVRLRSEVDKLSLDLHLQGWMQCDAATVKGKIK